MGVHMLGARDIILGRGKEAHMSPVVCLDRISSSLPYFDNYI